MRKLALIMLAFVVVVAAHADKVKKPKSISLTQIPDQTVDLSPAPAIVAQQACANWARSAALEAMLAPQGVALDQEFWAFRLDGGKLCFDTWGDPERLAKEVGGEHVLDDGRRVTLSMTFTRGAPSDPGALIHRLRAGRTIMLVWQGRPFLLSGATFDEYIYPDGGRMFEFKELRLLDPQRRGDERLVRFSKTENDMSEIEGVLDVVSTTNTPQAWVPRRQQIREAQPWTPERKSRDPNQPWTPESRPWNPPPQAEPAPTPK